MSTLDLILDKIKLLREANIEPKYIVLSDEYFKELALANKQIFVKTTQIVLLFNIQVITASELEESFTIGV